MRCSWAEGDDDMRAYHDEEWGVPQHDDARLFELLTLEGAQAGLSWLTILKRRPGYVKAFKRFNPRPSPRSPDLDVERLVRGHEHHPPPRKDRVDDQQRRRRTSTCNKSGSSLDEFLWSFVDNKPIATRLEDANPTSRPRRPTPTLMSKELKKRGFRFVGPTTCYALMQAAGLVNDHDPKCFRYAEVRKLR